MKTKTQTPKLNVCTKTVAESFAGFSDQNLKKVALTLLKMLSKRTEKKDDLISDAFYAVDPTADSAVITFVGKRVHAGSPAKRVSKRKIAA
jgi:hypothetical protein